MQRMRQAGLGAALLSAVVACSSEEPTVTSSNASGLSSQTVRQPIDVATATVHAPAYAVANRFEMNEANVAVVYDVSDHEHPVLVYTDPNGKRTYAGDEIQATPTLAGTFVSVVIQRGVDTGSTTFSVLIPATLVDGSDYATIETEGVTASHRFSPFAAYSRPGQLEHYTFVSMRGTATHVEPAAAIPIDYVCQPRAAYCTPEYDYSACEGGKLVRYACLNQM